MKPWLPFVVSLLYVTAVVFGAYVICEYFLTKALGF